MSIIAANETGAPSAYRVTVRGQVVGRFKVTGKSAAGARDRAYAMADRRDAAHGAVVATVTPEWAS